MIKEKLKYLALKLKIFKLICWFKNHQIDFVALQEAKNHFTSIGKIAADLGLPARVFLAHISCNRCATLIDITPECDAALLGLECPTTTLEQIYAVVPKRKELSQ